MMQSVVGPDSASPIGNRVHPLPSSDATGKHRVHAELKQLEQEARFLEAAAGELFMGRLIEELEQLQKMEKAFTPCKEMLNNMETRSDPLLPLTIGPLNPLWDRWFEGPQDSKGCRCWILC